MITSDTPTTDEARANDEATLDEVLAVLNSGFRNISLPKLSPDDFADIRGALTALASARKDAAYQRGVQEAARVAEAHRKGRLDAHADALRRGEKREARDHESMAIEGLHIATAIRQLASKEKG